VRSGGLLKLNGARTARAGPRCPPDI